MIVIFELIYKVAFFRLIGFPPLGGISATAHPMKSVLLSLKFYFQIYFFLFNPYFWF